MELRLIDSKIYFNLKYSLKTTHNPLYWRWEHIAHPFDLRSADPKNINKVSNRLGINKWNDAGKIDDGNWDLTKNYFDQEHDLYNSFKCHFQDQVPWEETDYYKRVVKQISEGRVQWGCESEKEFKSRCETLDQIFEDMKERGYRSQKELVKERGDETSDEPFIIRGSYLENFDEVAVDIGRDGDLLFVDGRNRLAIAKILGINEIPIRVVARHKEWQKKREKIGECGIEKLPEYSEHPDIQDLV